jgi:hypothetical protein
MFKFIKKKLILSLSLCILFLSITYAITFASAADKQGDFFRSKEKYFSIYFPVGWSIEEGRNPHVVVKSRSADKIASIIITHVTNIGKKPITESLTSKDLVKKYIESGWNVKIIDSGKTTFWNEQALYVRFLATVTHLDQTVKMIMWQIAFNHLGEGYTIAYSVGGSTDKIVNDNYIYYEPQFRKSLASFSLEDYSR